MDAAIQYFSEHPVPCLITIGVIALLIYGMCMNQNKDSGEGKSDTK